MFRALVVFSFLLCLQPRSWASAESASSDALALQEKIRLQPELLARLSQDEQWLKILFYVQTWFFGMRSLVDDPEFFAHPNGRADPEKELHATLDAFLLGSDDERQRALCKYPSRRLWLEKKFAVRFADPQPDNASEICKRNNIFRESVHARKASLIFSSYYPGNPGSLFGHTLLKFSKITSKGQSGSELLDYGLNHAAFPTTLNPLLYPVMGLSGFFPGYMSLMPYYVKVQEYNNAESRDLWEYELNLSESEIQQALFSVFELSTRRVDYYYFDDNCSLLMLAVIDVARPSLRLVDKFKAWVVPSDTVRMVFNQKDLVSNIKFRPSNIRRYLELEKKLSKVERESFDSLVELKQRNQFSTSPLLTLTREQKMNVMDTLLEFIDADEQLAGAKEPEKWKSERPRILQMRAQLGLASSMLEVNKPKNEAPHEAFPPTRVSLGVLTEVSPHQTPLLGTLLGWRPALHTLDNPVSGMGADLGIAFFNLEFLAHSKKVWLREFTPLSIETIPVRKPHFGA
ncbi:MAG: hypothetical protein RIR26_612, partial [Pseudomonadota bacterium]